MNPGIAQQGFRGAAHAWPQTGAVTAPPDAVPRTSSRGFLVATCVAVALSVAVVLEPSPSDILFAVLAVQGAIFANLRWTRSILLPVVLLAFFVAANLASLCFAIDLTQGLEFAAVTGFMLLSWFFVVGVLSKYQRSGAEALLNAFALGGTLCATASICAYFSLLPQVIGDELLFYDRIKGTFKDPNVFAPYLVIVIIFAINRLQMGERGRLRKALAAYAALISAVGVLLSFSRAAWINCVIAVVVYAALNALANRKEGGLRRQLIYFALISTLLSATIVYALSIPQISEVITYRTEMQSYDEDRFAMHDAALVLALDHPFGVGPGQSYVLLDYATHSLYLRVFSENGWIGSLSLGLFFLISLARALLMSQRAPTRLQRSLFALITAAIVGTAANSFVIDTLHWRHFWFVLAFAWMPVWSKEGLRMVRTLKPILQPWQRNALEQSRLAGRKV